MKKVNKILAAIIMLVSLNAGVAMAATSNTCSITGTGPGSNNVCQFDNNSNVIYTCVNDVLVVNGTNQTSASGIAKVDGNTYAGSASSGSAINEGETTTNVEATCLPKAKPAVTPTPPTPGQGGGEVLAVTTPAQVAKLPETGANTTAVVIGGLTLALGAVALVARFGLAAYRRMSL